MAKIKLDIHSSTIDDLLDYAEQVVIGCSPNPNFAAATAQITTLSTSQYNLAIAQANVKALELSLTTAIQARDILVGPFEVAFTAAAETCQGLSAGDGAKLTGGNWQLQPERQNPQPLPMVLNVSVTTGDEEGELDAQWDRLKNAASYEIQWTLTPESSGTWAPVANPTPTRSKTTLTGLTPGALVFIRVRGIGGSTGHGPWSDPAMGRVG